MATTDYTDRKVDVLFTNNWQEIGRFGIMTSFSENPQICTGVQKVAQSVALLLLTRRGSCKSDSLFGTTFLDRLESGITSELQLAAIFNVAAAEIREYLSRNIVDLDDERLASLELISMNYQPGGIQITVRVLTTAGRSREIVLPVGAVIK